MCDRPVTCDCCLRPTTNWTGYYCSDTPILKSGDSAKIEEHNRLRLWLCRDCRRHVMREILKSGPRAAWQRFVERARAGLRPGEGGSEEDRKEVDRFLREHPFLVLLVREAQWHLSRLIEFGETRLSLRVVCDREADFDEQLVLYVDYPGDGKSAFAMMRRFDEEWWLENMHRAKDKFHVNVEFR